MAKEPKKRLGEKLVEAGVIDDIQLTVALGLQKESGLKIGQQLLKLGFIDERLLSKFLVDEVDTGISLLDRKITQTAIDSVPEKLAFKHRICPVAFDGKTIILATANPRDLAMVDEVGFSTGKRVHPVKALEWDIDNALLKYYKGFSDDEMERLVTTSSIADQYKNMMGSMENEFNMATIDGSDVDSAFDNIEIGGDAEETSINVTGFQELDLAPQSAAPEAPATEPLANSLDTAPAKPSITTKEENPFFFDEEDDNPFAEANTPSKPSHHKPMPKAMIFEDPWDPVPKPVQQKPVDPKPVPPKPVPPKPAPPKPVPPKPVPPKPVAPKPVTPRPVAPKPTAPATATPPTAASQPQQNNAALDMKTEIIQNTLLELLIEKRIATKEEIQKKMVAVKKKLLRKQGK